MLKKIKSIFTKNKENEYPDTPFSKIGGIAGVDKLVNRFYYHMDSDQSVKECRDLHQDDLSSANEKLREFLYGWLGGPSIYVEKYGHPMMRKRHFPFHISHRERDQWLLCMRNALNDLGLEASLDEYLWQAFRKFAQHMQNQ